MLAASSSSASAGDGSHGSRRGGSPIASDSAEARAYVEAHNAVRAAVKKPAGYSGPWTPLPPVTWSDEVASTAQAWADNLRETMHCGLRHDSGTRYGENLAAGRKLDAAGAVGMWAGEIDHYRFAPSYVFENDTGHYTQMVWRKTTRIGCGRARCGRDAVIACRYSPAGNYIGRAPY
jgi:pathogenesis-related protein 1